MPKPWGGRRAALLHVVRKDPGSRITTRDVAQYQVTSSVVHMIKSTNNSTCVNCPNIDFLLPHQRGIMSFIFKWADFRTDIPCDDANTERFTSFQVRDKPARRRRLSFEDLCSLVLLIFS